MTEFKTPRQEYAELMAVKEAAEYADGDTHIRKIIETFLLNRLFNERNRTSKPDYLRKDAEQKAAYLLWLSEHMSASDQYCKYSEEFRRNG